MQAHNKNTPDKKQNVNGERPTRKKAPTKQYRAKSKTNFGLNIQHSSIENSNQKWLFWM